MVSNADECSMMSAGLLETVHKLLQHRIEGKPSYYLLKSLFGNLFQLPAAGISKPFIETFPNGVAQGNCRQDIVYAELLNGICIGNFHQLA